MDDSSGNSSLAVADLLKFIEQAKVAAADPVSVAMQLFTGLADNASVSGDVLRQALSDTAIPVSEPFTDLLSGVQAITKTGDTVAVTNSKDTETILAGNHLRINQKVSFEIGLADGLPAVSNIVGLSVHEALFWIGIQSIQLRQNQGRRSVNVVTSAGSRDIVLS